jgi:hypothetical protein
MRRDWRELKMHYKIHTKRTHKHTDKNLIANSLITIILYV